MRPDEGADPLVSCIVTAYNCGPFLRRALESALAQEVPGGCEVIVVDDGSTDETASVLQGLADRVRIVRQTNGGVCSATNRGVDEARGTYLTFLDGDDVLLPGKIRRQVEVLDTRPEVGLVYCDLEVVDAQEGHVAPSFLTAHGLTPRSGQALGTLLYHNVVPTCLMVRAALRDSWHPIDVDALAQDWWIAAGVAGVAELHFLPEPLYRYRSHGGNRFLDATPERQRLLVRREVPFRRRLLTTAPLERASAAEVAAASVAFERSVAIAVQVLGLAAEELVPVGPADQAAGCEAHLAAARAVAAEDDESALRGFVRALAHDPWDAGARTGLATATARLEAAERTAEAVVADRLADCRPVVVVTSAAELLDDPSLLAAHAAAVTANDPVTLLIVVGDRPDPTLEGRLLDAVTSAGLAGEGAPDMVAVTLPATPAVGRELARRTAGRLAHRDRAA